MSTTEDWAQVMWFGVDISGIDQQPIKDNNLISSLYFIFFILFGSLFIMNLFVGVVINSFKEEKEKLGMNHILTDTQKEWVQVQLKCFQSKPKPKDPPVKNIITRICMKITKSSKFEIFISICIIINIGILACSWYDESLLIQNYLETVNHIFTAIFAFEAIIKIIALRKLYFKDRWDNFDFVILIGTLIQILIDSFVKVQVGVKATIMRIFRIGRILRIVKKAQSLKEIFTTLIITIPQLANIGCLLFLNIFLYSILGMNIFGKIQLNGELDVYSNFQNFGNAFLTMIRSATGESWENIMYSLMNQNSLYYECVDDPSYDQIKQNNGQPNGCGSHFNALIFYITYILLVTFIFLNLFIAIILDGFQDIKENEQIRVTESTILQFQTIWQEFDPNGTGFINVNNIHKLFRMLICQDAPLIRGGQFLLKSEKEMNQFIAELELPTYNKFRDYHYTDILNNLSRTMFKIDFEQMKLVNQETNTQMTTRIEQPQIKNQDQFQFENFEELMLHFAVLAKKHKISLYEEYSKQKQIQEQKKIRLLDTFEGKFYDSRVIILMPKLIQQMKKFTQQMREKRLTKSKSQNNCYLNTQIMQTQHSEGNKSKRSLGQKRLSILSILARKMSIMISEKEQQSPISIKTKSQHLRTTSDKQDNVDGSQAISLHSKKTTNIKEEFLEQRIVISKNSSKSLQSFVEQSLIDKNKNCNEIIEEEKEESNEDIKDYGFNGESQIQSLGLLDQQFKFKNDRQKKSSVNKNKIIRKSDDNQKTIQQKIFENISSSYDANNSNSSSFSSSISKSQSNNKTPTNSVIPEITENSLIQKDSQRFLKQLPMEQQQQLKQSFNILDNQALFPPLNLLKMVHDETDSQTPFRNFQKTFKQTKRENNLFLRIAKSQKQLAKQGKNENFIVSHQTKQSLKDKLKLYLEKISLPIDYSSDFNQLYDQSKMKNDELLINQDKIMNNADQSFVINQKYVKKNKSTISSFILNTSISKEKNDSEKKQISSVEISEGFWKEALKTDRNFV